MFNSLKGLLSSLLLILIVFILSFGNPIETFSIPKLNLSEQDSRVVEYLRIHVPESLRDSWLQAEKASWEPWLAKQDGFLGRELYWDKENEEGFLLISWASRSQWKNIPQKEIELVQDSFENFAREETGQKKGNPFPLRYEGELSPQ